MSERGVVVIQQTPEQASVIRGCQIPRQGMIRARSIIFGGNVPVISKLHFEVILIFTQFDGSSSGFFTRQDTFAV